MVIQDCSCEVMITMTCGESQSSIMTPVYWPVVVEEDEFEAAGGLYDVNIDDCE